MDQFNTLFKALSDDTRLRILHALSYRDLCVCEMTALFGEAQPKISKHLSKLKDLGLVQTTRQEKYMYYTLTPEQPLLHDLVALITKHIPENSLLIKDHTHLNTPSLWACIGVDRASEEVR